MDRQEFLKQQQEATERLRRMHERSKITETPHTMPPTPSFLHLNTRPAGDQAHQHKKNPIPTQATAEAKTATTQPSAAPHQDMHNNSFLPLDLATMLHDSDATLILGLLLLLYSEHADRKLLLALLYILI